MAQCFSSVSKTLGLIGSALNRTGSWRDGSVVKALAALPVPTESSTQPPAGPAAGKLASLLASTGTYINVAHAHKIFF